MHLQRPPGLGAIAHAGNATVKPSSYFHPTRCWTKLKRDGARGLAVVPTRPGSPWWPLLLQGKVLDAIHVTGQDLVVPAAADTYAHAMRAQAFSIVAFDFASPAPPPSSPCPQLPLPAQHPTSSQDHQLALMHRMVQGWLLDPPNLEQLRQDGLEAGSNCL